MYVDFLDGNAHGHSSDLRPSVGQVLYDGADSLRLFQIIVSTDDTSPYLELTGCALVEHWSGVPNQELLVSGPPTVGEFVLFVDYSLQDTPLAVNVDDEFFKARQKHH